MNAGIPRACQGARANACAFGGGIIYAQRHGAGLAAAQHLARERRRRMAK